MTEEEDVIGARSDLVVRRCRMLIKWLLGFTLVFRRLLLFV